MARGIGHLGVRGKDYVAIFHAPEAPDEAIKAGDDRFVKFKNGLLVAEDEETAEVVRRALAHTHGRFYIEVKPEDEKNVLVCDECMTPWYGSQAYQRHFKFKHKSGYTRK